MASNPALESLNRLVGSWSTRATHPALRWQLHDRVGSVNSREMVDAAKVTTESSNSVSFRAPFEAAGPAVLYLKKVSS